MVFRGYRNVKLDENGLMTNIPIIENPVKLICRANQLNGFYMIRGLFFNEFTRELYTLN